MGHASPRPEERSTGRQKAQRAGEAHARPKPGRRCRALAHADTRRIPRAETPGPSGTRSWTTNNRRCDDRMGIRIIPQRPYAQQKTPPGPGDGPSHRKQDWRQTASTDHVQRPSGRDGARRDAGTGRQRRRAEDGGRAPRNRRIWHGGPALYALQSASSIRQETSTGRSDHRLPGGALPRAPLGWVHLKAHSSPIVNRQAEDREAG